MRAVSVAVVALLFAGCTSPPPADVDPTSGTEPNADDVTVEGVWPATLLDATIPWNRLEGQPFSMLVQGVHMAGQSIRPACVDVDGEPDEWASLRIWLREPVPVGAGHLSVRLDWDDLSYLRDDAVMAYKAPGGNWVEGAYQPRGEVTTIPLDAPTSDEPWEFALCLARGDDYSPISPAYRPGPAHGDFEVLVQAVA